LPFIGCCFTALPFCRRLKNLPAPVWVMTAALMTSCSKCRTRSNHLRQDKGTVRKPLCRLSVAALPLCRRLKNLPAPAWVMTAALMTSFSKCRTRSNHLRQGKGAVRKPLCRRLKNLYPQNNKDRECVCLTRSLSFSFTLYRRQRLALYNRQLSCDCLFRSSVLLYPALPRVGTVRFLLWQALCAVPFSGRWFLQQSARIFVLL